ncbi:MAG: hypothetical protein RLZZ561_1355 [Pseudomonadota bacterium]|jgi:hypothetical protein
MTQPNDEFNRRRRQRSLVTAGLLVGMCLLFYFITLVRIQG